MVIVAGTLQVEPAQRGEFLSGCEESMLRSRSEAGCLDYVFSADPMDPGTVRLFERWESEGDLAAHLARPPATPARTTIPISARDIVRYDVSGERRLGS